MKNAISVIVIDDHPLFRRGVVELLNECEDINVIAEFDNASNLNDELKTLSADLILLDLQMPDKSGLDVLREIRKKNNAIKILLLTACAEQDKILDALRYGANGYLQKDAEPDEILSQIRLVQAGHIALNADAVTSIAHHLREHHLEESQQPQSQLATMTDRERETLSLIAKGLNNKLIARELGISDGTVKVYVKSLLRKLHCHSRLELAAWTHQHLSSELLDQGTTR